MGGRRRVKASGEGSQSCTGGVEAVAMYLAAPTASARGLSCITRRKPSTAGYRWRTTWRELLAQPEQPHPMEPQVDVTETRPFCAEQIPGTAISTTA
jgi:hypothetical protein